MRENLERFLAYAICLLVSLASIVWSAPQFLDLFDLLDKNEQIIRIQNTDFSLIFIIGVGLLIFLIRKALQGFPHLTKENPRKPETQKVRDIKLGLSFVSIFIFSFMIFGGTKLIFKIFAHTHGYEICQSERLHNRAGGKSFNSHKIQLCKKEDTHKTDS